MNLTPMQLEKFRPEITQKWLSKFEEEVVPSNALDRPVILDGLPDFLEILIGNLMAGEVRSVQKSVASDHGRQRSSIEGFSISQLVKEYSLLRLIVLETLSQLEGVTANDRKITHETFDQAIECSCQTFSNAEQAQIKLALAAAESSNRALDHFSAAVAHDLKSPLATILGYTEAVVDDHGAELCSEVRDSLGVVARSTDRLISIVDGFLSRARLNCRIEKFTRFRLGEVLKSVLENLESMLSESEAQIKFHNLPEVQGDESLIIQLFQNLIANSIKYRSHQLPVILISAEEVDDGWIVSVEDNGRGFDPQYSTAVFELYKQLDCRNFGSGIGLATCKQIVAIHGGQIWCTSAVGRGATFSFTLKK